MVHLQADATVRQFGLLSFPYAADSETVELRYVRVCKPDGSVLKTDLSAVQDIAAENTQEASLHSDEPQLQLPVRSLSAGDRLEYEAVSDVRKAEASNGFWSAQRFERNAVTLGQRIELRFPSSRKVTVLSPGYKAVQRTENVTACTGGTTSSANRRCRLQQRLAERDEGRHGRRGEVPAYTRCCLDHVCQLGSSGSGG